MIRIFSFYTHLIVNDFFINIMIYFKVHTYTKDYTGFKSNTFNLNLNYFIE